MYPPDLSADERRTFWLNALGTALLFAFCALSARLFMGYPRCQNDELNWQHIIREIDRGQDWPVSGPSFVFLLRAIKDQTQLHYTHLLPSLGVMTVLLGTILITLCYARMRIARPGTTRLVLALSSYFWVPLLEARPQQWGQILVLMGAISSWLWLHRRGGGVFFVVLPLISVSHILSHAILVWLCVVLTLADFFENKPLTRRHAALLAALLLSLVVYIVPNGPYQTMLRDIEANHLRQLLAFAPYLAAAALAVVIAFILMRPRFHWRAHWSVTTARYALAHQHAISLGLVACIAIALLLQALVLPSPSWFPYGGSALKFFLFQTGNLLFALCFIAGLFRFLQATVNLDIAPSAARFLLWSLIAFGALACLTLLGSFWLLHTNWLLRLINYAILFASPIAALGFTHLVAQWPRRWVWLGLTPFFILSISQAVRPVGFLGC